MHHTARRCRFVVAPGIAAALVAAIGGGLAACAPPTGNAVVSPYAVGTAGYVSYGTVLQMRPVQVAGTRSGAGAAIGAASGGLVGSTIGYGWRERTVAGVGGALIGGLAGAAIEEGVTRGSAFEFLIQEDRGGTISVIQTNEEAIQPGERVAISRGDRVRIARAAPGAPPAPAYYAPPGGSAGRARK